MFIKVGRLISVDVETPDLSDSQAFLAKAWAELVHEPALVLKIASCTMSLSGLWTPSIPINLSYERLPNNHVQVACLLVFHPQLTFHPH